MIIVTWDNPWNDGTKEKEVQGLSPGNLRDSGQKGSRFDGSQKNMF